MSCQIECIIIKTSLHGCCNAVVHPGLGGGMYIGEDYAQSVIDSVIQHGISKMAYFHPLKTDIVLK